MELPFRVLYRDVSIIGIGQTPVGEHWSISLRQLAMQAVQEAMNDAGLDRVDALYVANMLAGEISNQRHLGALMADFAGLVGVEAITVEAADASGGAAIRQAVLAISSGAVDSVLVLGIEKFTDVVGSAVTTAQTRVFDADYEAIHGLTNTALGALLMRRYMVEYGVGLKDFAGFSINAHANGVGNPNAMFRRAIKEGHYINAPLVADPVNLFDSAPVGDGAAALILCAAKRAPDMVPHPVRIAASALATDVPALHDRKDILFLAAVNKAAGRALSMAGIGPEQVDVLELHDSFTVLTALQLEASGFAQRGQGWMLANNGDVALDGRIPISTHGGLKARGDVGGATGVYQVVEVASQLRKTAGDCQVSNPHWGMTINLGGTGGTAVAHILEAMD
ncbi:MAG: thiolase domain-containing protein [Anaerolineales bacterium]|nr:thiolase domain-containing protein [Anaerolineales bacterium]